MVFKIKYKEECTYNLVWIFPSDSWVSPLTTLKRGLIASSSENLAKSSQQFSR